MTRSFFKFPRTPHVAWLSDGPLRDDKLLSPTEAEGFLSGPLIIEEKVDGANTGISVSESGQLLLQNRGEYLGRRAHPQYAPIWGWLGQRYANLVRELGETLILFGEWCFALHSVRYRALPDWFLGFDVYDRKEGHFWSTPRRNGLFGKVGVVSVPLVARGKYSLDELMQFLESSALVSGPPEGIYLRRENEEWLESRAKLVRPEFVQTIEEHWSTRTLEKNRLRAE